MTDQELQTKAAEYLINNPFTDFQYNRLVHSGMDITVERKVQEAVKYGYELAMAEIKNNPKPRIMTEEQLNQKAEEYGDEHSCDLSYDSDIDDRSECLQKAYKAGYAEAQPEWRYVEDGLPDTSDTVIVAVQNGSNDTYRLRAWWFKGEWHNPNGTRFNQGIIYAWQPEYQDTPPPLPPAKNQG